MATLDELAHQLVVTDREWQARAACASLPPRKADRIFFPKRGGSSTEARKICAGCPVRETCLEWAIENDIEYGIWGGASVRERRAMREASGSMTGGQNGNRARKLPKQIK